MNVHPSTSNIPYIFINPNIEGKRRKVHSFNDKWLEVPEFKEWLIKWKNTEGETVSKCKCCNKLLSNHRTVLRKHSEIAKHKETLNSTKSTEKILQTDSLDEMAKRAELKIASLLATNNLPLLLCDTLVPLIANICPDSKIAHKMSMGRTKATAVINQILGPNFCQNIVQELQKPGKFFSLIMEEMTDQGSVKQCAITVIYNRWDSIKASFFDMIEMSSGTAEDLFSGLISAIKNKNIPLSNLVGFSSDTINTMVDQHNSVFSRLKEEIPHITCIKCSCHMVQLAASKACLKLPQSVEDMLSYIGFHFSRSYSRQKKLEDMQIYFKINIHKIPPATRWLSLKECIDKVLEQYEALESYFYLEVFKNPSKVTQSILSSLKHKFTKLYLQFMSYSLDILNDFNTFFQSESPLLYKLKSKTEKLIKTIAANYIDLRHCKENNAFDIEHTNPKYFLTLNKVYLGMPADETLSKLRKEENPPHENEIQNFQKNCLNFYIELISEIKKRFDFTDPIFTEISIIDPSQSYEIKNLSSIIKRFPVLKQIINEQLLFKEWLDYSLLDHRKFDLNPNLPIEKYWKKVFKLKDHLFPNLKIVVYLLLILPFSNASVERVFSKLKKLKTESRNELRKDIIISLMNTSEGIANAGGLIKFEPSKSMLKEKCKY